MAYSRAKNSKRRALATAIAVAVVAYATAVFGDVCATVNKDKDNLSDSDRVATETLFQQALESEGERVVPSGCGETWSVYHVKLGDSITVVMSSPRGTRREKVDSVEDIPDAYSQMVRSLRSGEPITREGGMVDRRNVRGDQAFQNRVEADSLWFLRIGYGAIFGDGFSGGPAFGFGYRHELDRLGIDLSFVNLVLADSDSDEVDGVSGSFVKVMGLYFFDPYANSTPYAGAGLSWGGVAVERDGVGYSDSGLQGELSLGYALLRASTIRLFAQLDGTLPIYTADGTDIAGEPDSIWAPTLTLSLGAGWGKSRTVRVKVDD